ncbi:hypothetical protein WJN01_01475 [Flavobacteriaceae bacterium SZ-1-7]|uniref:hypothetical protein n=1 Tax=Tamlana sedimenti TaxID=3134126 RepID=UPI003120B269
MKRICATVTSLLMTLILWAQSPEMMSYQAIIRNASNELVVNQGVGMQISILQGSASGAAVFVETHQVSTNGNGLITVEIGAGITSDDFSAINWGVGPYFIKTETDPSVIGGVNYTITGVSRLLSVPYALHAKTAEAVTGVIDDADADPANEKITNVQLNGSMLEITEGGQTYSVDLGSLTSEAYNKGFADGYNAAYSDGYSDGYTDGQIDGYNDGYNAAYGGGYSNGYNDGYTDGFVDGSNSN